MTSQVYSSLAPMAYVLNTVDTQSQVEIKHIEQGNQSVMLEQVARIQEQNQTLQRKLHNKTQENVKLQNKVNRLEAESKVIKNVLQQINSKLRNGETPAAVNAEHVQNLINAAVKFKPKGSKSFSKKSKNEEPCHCCYVAEKPYSCDWDGCNKRFRQKIHLEAHKNVHIGQRFQCDYPGCNKSFCRKYSLDEHRKMHTHGNPNQCTYPNCGKSFSSKYGLLRHQTAQHTLSL